MNNNSIFSTNRYTQMPYRRCGSSGLQLPMITLGLWHNFGTGASDKLMTDMLIKAFDSGIVSFDLANNYGPMPGSAEENFGRILKKTFNGYRDEMVISTKAGRSEERRVGKECRL